MSDRIETFALNTATGSARLDELHIGQKARLADGGQVRTRLLSRFVPEQVGPPMCPIMLRWTLFGSTGDGWRLVLHRFPPYSDDRDPHDHPCRFWTLVLAGGYDDLVPVAQEWFYCQTCGDHFETKLDAKAHLVGTRWHAVTRDHAAVGLIVGDRMRRGSFRYRPAEHRHRTRAGSGGCWSLVLMAPKSREWGFWRGRRWLFWKDYEREFGFGMRCE